MFLNGDTHHVEHHCSSMRGMNMVIPLKVKTLFDKGNSTVTLAMHLQYSVSGKHTSIWNYMQSIGISTKSGEVMLSQ